MIERFFGEAGRRLLVDALMGQKMIAGNLELAEKIADTSELLAVLSGETIIEQDASDNNVYLIISGEADIIVNGTVVGHRIANDHVGEMAAIEPTQKRSATVIFVENGVVAKISEASLAALGASYPEIYRCIAKELSKRLKQRNVMINKKREKIRVFIISSAESLSVAREVQNAFAHEDFLTKVWTDGVFKITNYTLQSLEDEIDDSDFAIAIAHADDMTLFRGNNWPSPRDNVIFELGLFMGRLGKNRAILMEPRDDKVKLPSDLSGLTTIPYRFEAGKDAAALIAPACNALRDHILNNGPNN